MLKKIGLLAAALALWARCSEELIGVALIMNPAANASCTTTGSAGVAVGNVPDSLEVTRAPRPGKRSP